MSNPKRTNSQTKYHYINSSNLESNKDHLLQHFIPEEEI